LPTAGGLPSAPTETRQNKGWDKVSDLPTRKPNRLKNYDYSQNGAYFITICVKGKHEMLGEIVNGQAMLSEYGFVVKGEIENIPSIRKECIIENYVVMPNHIHIIVRIVGDDGNRPADTGCLHRADCHPPLRKSVSNMVQGFKGAVTRQIGFSFWQRSFHDHIIRNEVDYNRISAYIDNNPARWHEDCFYPR